MSDNKKQSEQEKQIEKLELLAQKADGIPRDKVHVEKLKKSIKEKKQSLEGETPIYK